MKQTVTDMKDKLQRLIVKFKSSDQTSKLPVSDYIRERRRNKP